MFKRIVLILAVLLAAVSCSTSRRVTQQMTPQQSWKGHSAEEIIDKMGDPVRIDEDGRGGSILVYETAPDYDDPGYDILNSDAATAARLYAHFYLDQEGVCYQVDANCGVPDAPRYTSDWGWLDTVLLLLLVTVLI